MSEAEGFLSRWSRRKRAAGGAAAPPPPPDLPAAPEAGTPPPPVAEAPAFDPASLPPLESLTADSDFAAFLREEVPAVLRQAALRRAWSLDPAIRDFVGPADYAWDFNAPGGVPGFSLELLGDVKSMVAQAVGLVSEPDEAPADAATAEVEAPPAGAPVAEAGRAGEETPPPTVEARAEPSPEALPAPEPLPVAEPTTARRRHGGAVPS